MFTVEQKLTCFSGAFGSRRIGLRLIPRMIFFVKLSQMMRFSRTSTIWEKNAEHSYRGLFFKNWSRENSKKSHKIKISRKSRTQNSWLGSLVQTYYRMLYIQMWQTCCRYKLLFSTYWTLSRNFFDRPHSLPFYTYLMWSHKCGLKSQKSNLILLTSWVQESLLSTSKKSS